MSTATFERFKLQEEEPEIPEEIPSEEIPAEEEIPEEEKLSE